MKTVIKKWKERDYNYVYTTLQEKKYQYTLDNLEKDFSSISSIEKYCYLIYLLSKDNSPSNTILICDFLIYTDTFFFDIYPVIRFFIQQSLGVYPFNKSILRWIVDTYDSHPDSPFSEKEMNLYKLNLDKD